MSQADGGAWWAEVEHLREPLERRRAACQPESSRRTVRIRGQAIAGTSARQLHAAAETPPPRRLDPLPRERPRRSAPERLGSRPDRIAAWAVVFGLMMAVMAAATAKGATPARLAAGPDSAHAIVVAAPAPARAPAR
ncbi:MAG TPA: hypothetical protein VFR49_02835 [Solirubrobacteraceae bacterium]|nr:hypothetical protein [Solirubrobacteraceae bacterium]